MSNLIPGETETGAHQNAPRLGELARKLATEIAVAQPGKDIGLLPINSFMMEVGELVAPAPVPAAFRDASSLAQKWLDTVFDTTGVFDSTTLTKLAEWSHWLESAATCWAAGREIPERTACCPADGKVSPAAGQDLPTPPPPAPTEAEPTIVLNVESDADLLREFLNESQEHLLNIEQGVLVLEENPSDADTLNSIFRAFHTFKGGSGFLNLTAIKDLAHELESLLDAVRQHQLKLDSAVINVILEGGDTLKQFAMLITARLNSQETGQPILVPTRNLIARVQAILAQPKAQEEKAAPVACDNHASTPSAAAEAGHPEQKASSSPAPETAKANGDPQKASGSTTQGINGAGFVKVDTQKLDSLIDLVGELVISESMVVQDPELRSLPSRNLARNLAQLGRITSELQRTAMSLRMVPIRATFQKMTRLVRDLSARQQKQVHLVLNGEETELDRNIVESISDPLIHMIRNAADHGIEKPDARIARGKPALGTIHLRAFHRGGNIVIQIQDDGNGLDRERILAKAREKGIVAKDETLSNKEICDLIFAPGFSTAEVVSDISGRGVGMDVVRRNIEKLRGKVEIETAPGQGTTFTIYLPLTLAIIDGMIVSVGGERFIIPTLSVRESFRPKPEMISTVYERGEMVNVRGRLSPLLRLDRYFDQAPRTDVRSDGIVVVVESGQQTRCLMVDELLGKQEVVIKSLGGALQTNQALAGGAVLGDGRVGLILNIDSLVRLSSTTSVAA